MPLLTPSKGETQDKFIARCMGSDVMASEYPDNEQRAAVCYSQWRRRNSGDRIIVTDRITYAITNREITPQGYLKVPGRVARSGIQQYLASEIGLTDRKPNEIINVYRPPEEVFKDECLYSYDNIDITNDHPDDLVDASSYKKVSVGHAISEGKQDGNFVVVDLLIKDKEAIDEINKGKVELSAGYEAEYVPQKGISEDGKAYDYVQRNIRVNHVALVDKARAGHQAKLFDKQMEVKSKMPKIVTLDKGLTVSVEDESTATLIQSTIDGLRQKADDAEARATKAEQTADEMTAKKEKMDEDLEKEKEKTSDAAISTRVKAVIDTMKAALKIAGKDFTCDGVDVTEIQKAALTKVRPTVDWKEKSEHYVQAAWDAEMEKKESEDEDEEDPNKRKPPSSDSLNKDLENLYTGDDGRMVGNVAYDQFLKGGE